MWEGGRVVEGGWFPAFAELPPSLGAMARRVGEHVVRTGGWKAAFTGRPEGTPYAGELGYRWFISSGVRTTRSP